MPALTWDFARELDASATPGNTTSFYDEMCQSLYIDDGYIRTQIAELVQGQWQDITRETEITVSEAGYGILDIEHHFNGAIYGSAQHSADVVFLMYEYMADLTEWLEDGYWLVQPDNAIKTGTAVIMNGDKNLFEDSTFTLFAPGNLILYRFTAGDSEFYTIGAFYIETSPFADIATSFAFRGRNAVGFFLAGQTFDDTVTYTGTRTAIIQAILEDAGVPATLFQIETSAVETTFTFEDQDSYFDGLQRFVEHINWYMDDQPTGKIVVGSESYVKTNVAATGIHSFVRGSEIFTRKVDRSLSGVYSRVCVRRKTPDPVLRVYGDIPYFDGWNLAAHRTFYQDVPETTTQGEMESIRDLLIEELQYTGIVEVFSSPFRPWLQPGDVCTITGEGARIVGIITDVSHRFGRQGYFTEFTVTSGGTISNPDNPLTVATRYKGKLGGANRKRRLLDFILARDNTSKGDKGDPGPQGEDSTVPGPGIAAGGSAGNLLTKVDGTDYNTQWSEGNLPHLNLVGDQFDASGYYQAEVGLEVWNDLQLPALSGKPGTSKIPGFSVFKTNGSGSQGVFLYWFDASAEEELYFAVQMPHSWVGTAIKPHVHWTPAATADGDPASQTVEWGLEYTWIDIGGDFGNTQIVYGKTHTPADADVVAGRHYLTPLTDITPSASQEGISSMMICRVFRNATDAVDDTYEQDAGLLQLDFHYESDMLGSRTETAK